jgi:hypothetical protein
MAKIRRIDFYRTGKQDGCLCDRCGQYIQNIWKVEYADGITARFGIDCFEILNKESGLTTFGMKELNKALKRIRKHRELYEAELLKTEETDDGYREEQELYDWKDKGYWYGKPWEEYHEWRINEFFKFRFEEDQKEIERFSKVNFAR